MRLQLGMARTAQAVSLKPTARDGLLLNWTACPIDLLKQRLRVCQENLAAATERIGAFACGSSDGKRLYQQIHRICSSSNSFPTAATRVKVSRESIFCVSTAIPQRHFDSPSYKSSERFIHAHHSIVLQRCILRLRKNRGGGHFRRCLVENICLEFSNGSEKPNKRSASVESSHRVSMLDPAISWADLWGESCYRGY